MSKTATSGQEVTGAEPNASASTVDDAPRREIEGGRFARACSEAIECEQVADRFYSVHSASGSTYDVDLATGACSCPDAERRGDQYVCKHAIRACLVDVIAEGKVRSLLAARVVSHSLAEGCPAGGHGGRCNGPLAATDAGTLPCPTCCDSTRSPDTDEFDVWRTVVDRRRGQRGRGR